MLHLFSLAQVKGSRSDGKVLNLEEVLSGPFVRGLIRDGHSYCLLGPYS